MKRKQNFTEMGARGVKRGLRFLTENNFRLQMIARHVFKEDKSNKTNPKLA